MNALSPETASRIMLFNMQRIAPPRRQSRTWWVYGVMGGMVLAWVIAGMFAG